MTQLPVATQSVQLSGSNQAFKKDLAHSYSDNSDYEEEEFINEYTRPVTVTVSDGNSFKTVLGDQPMTPGGRYYFQLRVNAGYLIKIGVYRNSNTSVDVNKVSQ